MVLLESNSLTERAKGKRLEPWLREWDGGTRKQRLRQLETFVSKCADMTGPQLEVELDSGASLFLARISSWLRLSYALGHPVALPLHAIDMFCNAPSGQRCAANRETTPFFLSLRERRGRLLPFLSLAFSP